MPEILCEHLIALKMFLSLETLFCLYILKVILTFVVVVVVGHILLLGIRLDLHIMLGKFSSTCNF